MKLASMKKNMRAPAAACLALGLSLSLSSCGDKKPKAADTDQPADKSSEQPAGAATKPDTGTRADTSPPAAGTSRSQHFAAVAQHLDLGGTLFGYVDVDGDVEAIAAALQGFLDAAKQQAGDEMPPHIKTLSISKVLGDLGLDGIEAVGVSSYQDGDLYRNRAYMHIPAGRKGLLKMAGGDAGPFVAKLLAPKDADLIMEQSIDARAGFEVVSSMVAQLGGPEASREFLKMVSEAMPQFGLSMADLFRKLDTRITVIGRIHPDKPLEIPDAPVKIPSFDLLISFDNLGWLYGKVTTEMQKEMPADQQAQMFAKGDGFERVILPPLPDPDLAIVQPVIQHDLASKRVLIASTQAFLDECLAGSSKLSESADFTAATQGLPTEGNGLTYLSANLMDEYRQLVGEIVEAGTAAAPDAAPGSALGGQEAAIITMMKGLIPEAKGSQASVIVNTPEGILMASNSATSYKEAAVMGGVAIVAVGASLAIPALRMAQGRADEARSDAIRRIEELEALEEEELPPDPVPAPPRPAPIPAPQER